MILDKVTDTIKKYNMIEKGSSVYAAVSGGADSVALLYLLKSLEPRFDFTLLAVHVNHLLRGDESERDERFVSLLCEKLDVPLKIFRADIRSISANTKQGIEECARNVRYDFFKTLGRVATAHTLSDTAETVLFNLTRGTGIQGLIGIPPVRDFVIRPLCDCTRAEIEAYLNEQDIAFVTDSSNLSDAYTRNKIRHMVIPKLYEINPSFDKAVSNLTELLRMDNECLEEMAQREYEKDLDIGSLGLLPDAILSRVMIKRLEEKEIPTDFHHIKEIINIVRFGGKCQLSGGWFAETAKNRLRIFKPIEDTAFRIPLREGMIETPYARFMCEIADYQEMAKSKKIYNLLFKNILDYDKINMVSYMRSRLPGDRFMPEGHNLHKSFKNVCAAAGVPYDERNKLAVLESGKEILWISGIGRSQFCVPNKDTKRILIIKECL